MNKNNKHTLVPKLRFPEFQNEGEWEVKKLGEITEFVRNGLNINQTNEKEGYKVTRIETISEGRINIEKVGYIRTLQDIAEYKLLIGDMLFSNINSVAHIGKIAFIDKDYDLYHGMNLLNIRINQDEHCPKFYFYQLTNCRLKRYFEEICNKAVNQASINQTDLKKTELAFPSLPEQQKIASCLSSLDEVITAESQKLELYQQHKKGLLQNLFPQEGETVPKLRFPEFQNAGEWEESTLKNVSEIIMGSSPSSSSYNEKKLGLPLLQGNADIKDRKSAPRIYTSEITKECQIGDILLSVRAPVGTVAKSLHRACIGRGIAAIRSINNNSQEFLYQWLISYESLWKNISQGGTFDSVNSDVIRNLKVSVPSLPEQQKIAACLSSLDDLINAQRQKIELLKQHKKGLLQGLFPPINN